MAITAAESAEIKRKAESGIPLTNSTPEKLALYNTYKPSSAGVNLWAAAASKTPSAPIAYTGTASKSSSAPSATQDTAKAKREAEKAAYTGWDNIPAVRSLQEKWWAIYIDTGRKDTAEQLALNEQAQKIRSYENPMYNAAASPWGALDYIDAASISPPNTTNGVNSLESKLDAVMSPDNVGSVLMYGGLAIGAMVLLSMFRK